MGTVTSSYPVSMAAVRAALGGTTTTKLSEYVRGGAYVGNYPPNLSVPTSVPIRLGDLRGASSTPSYYADASPTTCTGTIASPGTCTTGSTTATAHGVTGGTTTYAWARVSGDSSQSAVSPTSATTAFRRTCTVANVTYTALWACTVTNTISGATVTNNVTVNTTYVP